MPYKDRKQQAFVDRRRTHRIAEYWLVDKGNRTDDARRKRIAAETEQYAEKLLNGELGFQYVLALNNTTKCAKYVNHNTRTIFPFFDFYCEKDGQKWFIDVTAYIKKEMPHTPLWERLGIKLAVLFVRRDLKQYCFREDTGKSAVELRLRDIGLPPVDLSEARARSWLTRRENGNVSWNKGLTKEGDPRIMQQANIRRGKPHPHIGTTRKGIHWSDSAKQSYVPWCKGLTKDTDERVRRRNIASLRAHGPLLLDKEFSNVQ